MTVTATLRKLISRQTEIIFRVPDSTPTSAELRFLKQDPDGKTWSEVTQTWALTSLGGELYRLQGHILADKYTVKLNTEPKVMTFENDYSDRGFDDLPLLGFTTTSGFMRLYVPYTDYNRLALEIYTADGEPLKTLTRLNEPMWYSENLTSPLVSVDATGRQRYYTGINISMFSVMTKLGSSAWVRLEDLDAVYVRVRSVKDNFSSNLLRNVLADPNAYAGPSYGALIDIL